MKIPAGGMVGLTVVLGLGLWLTSADSSATLPPLASVAPASTAASTSHGSPLAAPPGAVASGGVAVGLNFSTPGPLTSLLVKVGDRVTKGQPLASLDDTAARLSVEGARANADKATVALAALTQRPSTQDLAQIDQGEAQAAAAVAAAEQTLADAQAQANQDVVTQDGVVAAAEQASADAQAQANQDATENAAQIDAAQTQLAADEAQTPPDPGRIAVDAAALTTAKNTQVSTALKDAQQVHGATANVTNVQNNAAAAALHDAQAIHQAQAGVSAQQQQLAATKAADAVKTQPPNPAALANARDDVTVAQAQLQSAELMLSATTLRAPADGVIAAITGHVGESVSGGAAGTNAFITLEEPGTR